MTLSPEHEAPSALFTHLIGVLVEEIGLDYISLRSTTLWLQAIEGGVEAVEFYRLSGDHYVEIPASDLFPFLIPEALPGFPGQGLNEGIVAMRRAFRDWVKANRMQVKP